MMTVETNDYSIGIFDVPEEFGQFIEIFSIGTPNAELVQTPEKSVISLVLESTKYEVTFENEPQVNLKSFLKARFR